MDSPLAYLRDEQQRSNWPLLAAPPSWVPPEIWPIKRDKHSLLSTRLSRYAHPSTHRDPDELYLTWAWCASQMT